MKIYYGLTHAAIRDYFIQHGVLLDKEQCIFVELDRLTSEERRKIYEVVLLKKNLYGNLEGTITNRVRVNELKPSSVTTYQHYKIIETKDELMTVLDSIIRTQKRPTI